MQSDHTITVTRNGVPVAELSPIRRHTFTPRSVIAEAAARAPRLDAIRFGANLDAVVSHTVDA